MYLLVLEGGNKMGIENNSEFLIYQTEDGQTKVDVRMENETVWLSLNQMAELFQRDKSVVSRHIKNIFSEGELDEKSVVAFFATTAADGKTYDVAYFNLDVIISVGYDLLKKSGGGNYFEELLQRIRDIRSSEKVFYRKVLEIYATSIDYDPGAKTTQEFLKTVQNKMHYSTHGKTAAEIIYERADGEKPNMGLTSWTGLKPKKTDITAAKNYLTEEELDTLNRIVNMYLEFAELQAIKRKPMYMSDWISKLDEFMKISEREILTHAGKVSHEIAMLKANKEFEKFTERTRDELSQIEKHFIESIDDMAKQLKEKKRGNK